MKSGIRAYVGGNYGSASGAGLFCWNLNNPAGSAHTSVGCRLATRTRSRFLTGKRTAYTLAPAFLPRSSGVNRTGPGRRVGCPEVAPATKFQGCGRMSAVLGVTPVVLAFSAGTWSLPQATQGLASVVASQKSSQQSTDYWKTVPPKAVEIFFSGAIHENYIHTQEEKNGNDGFRPVRGQILRCTGRL